MLDKDFTFFICDFETTGINADVDYPIELGGIFTNSEFIIQDTVDSLIHYPEMFKRYLETGKDWDEEFQPAYKVHKISVKEWLENSKNIDVICQEIIEKCNKIKKGKRNVILISDNIQFEFNFMKRLFRDTKKIFPFHYCGWDTSLFLELTGIGDPKNVKHRAFDDAAGLYQHIIRAKERIDFHIPL